MAREVQVFDVTVPAGTLKTAPQVTALAMPARVVREIEVIIPPGPRGNVGFQIGLANRQLLPYTAGSFIVSDDETIRWPLEEMPSSGAWQVIAYNTGQFPHTLEFRFLVDLPGTVGSALPPMLEAGSLSSPVPIGTGSSSAPSDQGGTLPLPPLPPLPALPPPPTLTLPPLPPAPLLSPLPGLVLPAEYLGPPSWPLSDLDLTGIEL